MRSSLNVLIDRILPAQSRPVIMIVSGLLLSLLIYFGYLGTSWVEFLGKWTAISSSKVLNGFGYETHVEGTILASGQFSVNIAPECTAIGPIIIFIAAVLAQPASAKSTIIGLILGICTLSVINLLRIVNLFWIGINYPDYLSFAHLIVWQSVMIILAIILWLYWRHKASSIG